MLSRWKRKNPIKKSKIRGVRRMKVLVKENGEERVLKEGNKNKNE